MAQHPKWPDARNCMDCNCYPELHRMSVGQMEEEQQMHNIGSDY